MALTGDPPIESVSFEISLYASNLERQYQFWSG